MSLKLIIRDDPFRTVSSVFYTGTRMTRVRRINADFGIILNLFVKNFLFILLIFICQNTYSQWKKFAFSAEASPLLLYKYDKYETVVYKNKYNYLFGLGASAYFIDRKVDASFNSGIYIKTKNHYSEYWDNYPTGIPATSVDKYTFLSCPITIKCEINLNKHYLTFAEAGILLNWIVSKYFLLKYPDGSTTNKFDDELQFDNLNELYFAVGIGRMIPDLKSSIGLKPYLLYKYKDDVRYSYSYYNPGRLGMGVSLYYSFYIFRKSSKNK